jgi:hypothetical protein
MRGPLLFITSSREEVGGGGGGLRPVQGTQALSRARRHALVARWCGFFTRPNRDSKSPPVAGRHALRAPKAADQRLAAVRQSTLALEPARSAALRG